MNPLSTSQYSWIIGLDLAHSQDRSALALVRRQPKPRLLDRFPPPRLASVSVPSRLPAHYFDLLLLHRFSPGASYASVIEYARSVLCKPALAGRPASLVVDATGIGAPVVEMLRNARLGASLIPVTITSGQNASASGSSYRVPKSDLISNLSLLLASRSLRISRRLPSLQLLLHEFFSFRSTMSRHGNQTHGAASGEHDDLILAVALACWWARPKGPCGGQPHGPLW